MWKGLYVILISAACCASLWYLAGYFERSRWIVVWGLVPALAYWMPVFAYLMPGSGLVLLILAVVFIFASVMRNR
jgi:uncharacterized membrane protein HdeD (DUF308 family)